MIYKLLTLLGLTLVAVAMWLTLAPRQTTPGIALTSQEAGPESGYSATDARVVETGVDGLPQYTLQARQVQQQSDSNLIDLTAVQMTFRDSHGGQWQARADRARGNQDSAQIDLSGAVSVTGTLAGKPLTLRTDPLHVDTQAQIIRTPDPVAIYWVGKLTARGLVLNLKEQRLKLESQVHGQFVR